MIGAFVIFALWVTLRRGGEPGRERRVEGEPVEPARGEHPWVTYYVPDRVGVVDEPVVEVPDAQPVVVRRETDEELAAWGQRYMNRLTVGFCVVMALFIGGLMWWAYVEDQKREPLVCVQYPGPDGVWGTEDDPPRRSQVTGEVCPP